MPLEILEPGLSTSVQDRGRSGYYRYGIPQGGSMDQYSASIANRIVGNEPDDAVLECTYLGPRFTVSQSCLIAVTGAPVEVKVNGTTTPQWAPIPLADGDEVSFGVIQAGAKFFIAVSGGIDVPVALGSRSTYPIGSLGGFHGRTLAAGDSIPIGTPTGERSPLDAVAEGDLPVFTKEVEVRILLGLHDHLLTEEGRHNLLETDWTLTPVADRMGLRYSGAGIPWIKREQPFGAGHDPSNIVDAGYPVGSIQVPGGKQPIILHRDAVSGGGYAMVATVISADMDLLARSAPGTTTRFVAVTMDEALVARQDRARRLARIWS